MTDKLKEKEEFRYAPIGVFDSGVGGLTVAREIMRQIPKERIIYFGRFQRVDQVSGKHWRHWKLQIQKCFWCGVLD